ncbi:hypothetical protein [Arthrobacter sp. NEB 688]|uniref:hypothetical protein n=1 Tax=Arthrobacter sp. NEB 688 TaxID=904039 RepID=UPI00156304F0|nr:hypothetical protein [Arthrobacter sp. NEB 688]QKE82889.1 hypothetical protein HL663_02265 [Arthrobacter sp. NEB 688]
MNDNGLIVHADRLLLRDVTIVNAEAAALVAAAVSASGPAGALDLVRRALPIGLVALKLGSASVDTGSLERTLAGFRQAVDQSAATASRDLTQTIAQLRSGEQTVITAAEQVLTHLPARVEAALAGEAHTIRDSVRAVTAEVQETALRQVRDALSAHAASVRDAVSLDREGPVQMLRRDVLTQLDATRSELSAQLSALTAQVQAESAAQEAGRKSSRAVGDDWEAYSMAAARAVVTAAGDVFAETGSEAAAGTTRRTGDGVATLVVGASERPVRVVFEAKSRTRPLGPTALARELQAASENRDAQAAIAVVRTTSEVPGTVPLARVGPSAWVVALDGDQTALELVYLVVREFLRVGAARDDSDEQGVDVRAAQAHLVRAEETLRDYAIVRRHGESAQKSISALLLLSKDASARIHDELRAATAALNATPRREVA